jgi:hypothetical protein
MHSQLSVGVEAVEHMLLVAACHSIEIWGCRVPNAILPDDKEKEENDMPQDDKEMEVELMKLVLKCVLANDNVDQLALDMEKMFQG